MIKAIDTNDKSVAKDILKNGVSQETILDSIYYSLDNNKTYIIDDLIGSLRQDYFKNRIDVTRERYDRLLGIAQILVQKNLLHFLFDILDKVLVNDEYYYLSLSSNSAIFAAEYNNLEAFKVLDFKYNKRNIYNTSWASFPNIYEFMKNGNVEGLKYIFKDMDRFTINNNLAIIGRQFKQDGYKIHPNVFKFLIDSGYDLYTKTGGYNDYSDIIPNDRSQ